LEPLRAWLYIRWDSVRSGVEMYPQNGTRSEICRLKRFQERFCRCREALPHQPHSQILHVAMRCCSDRFAEHTGEVELAHSRLRGEDVERQAFSKAVSLGGLGFFLPLRLSSKAGIRENVGPSTAR
jgi:hypothetical protein